MSGWEKRERERERERERAGADCRDGWVGKEGGGVDCSEIVAMSGWGLGESRCGL